MAKVFDVCIRGDGIVGRTLALLLARQRLRVALVGRSPAGETRQDVRAYALNAASRQLLTQLRAWPAEPQVTPVTRMQVWGDDGGQIDFTPPAAGGQAELAWLVDVPALENELAQALHFAPEVQWIEAAGQAQAALTVVCEGSRSASRQEFGVQWALKPYAQKALAARLQSDQPHGGIARQWFKSGEVLALLPMGGAGGHALALVWSVSLERAAELEKLTPEAFTAELQRAAGPEVGQLSLTSEVSSWPLALARAERWVGPGWALAGDAAHTVHPLAGQGLNLGLADVRVLAEVLQGREYWRSLGDEKLLRRYERARKADVLTMGTLTDGLQGLFAQTDARWQALRNWGMTSVARSATLKTWLTRQAMG
jgi:2-polyprenyl-6-methoxyphenol hydroxylase-like FAD-dependent oxidoreductase